MTPLRIAFHRSTALRRWLFHVLPAARGERRGGAGPRGRWPCAGQLGLLTAAYLGAFALFQLPLGVLLDRYGPRKVQAGLLTLAALGCVAFAFAPGFIGLFAARAVIGLGFSAGLMASYKSSATWVPIERRSLANTAIMSVGAMGVVVATEPTEYLVSLIGWRNAFLVFAGVILLAALFILLAAPRKDTVGAPAPFKPSSRR